MKIALAQINTRVGDLRGNRDRILEFHSRAAVQGADLVVFPELTLCGYPPMDLLEQRGFVDANLEILDALAVDLRKGPAALIGHVDHSDAPHGKALSNAASLLHKGKVRAKRRKTLLPNYDVFDEARYFEPARSNRPLTFKGVRLGVTICEDAWNAEGFWGRPLYGVDPVGRLLGAGVDVVVNLSASPFHRGKTRLRERLMKAHLKRRRAPILFCNAVGGNDELIFDGNSFAMDARGRVVARSAPFAEDLLLYDTKVRARAARPLGMRDIDEIGHALIVGIKDYALKCGFNQAVVGLSGGVDSAVTAALAVRALGADAVTGVAMPSKVSSKGSVVDAAALARNLGIRMHKIPIAPVFDAFRAQLHPAFRNTSPDVTEQNLQARARGSLLMAFSNKFGSLLLSTGNKSELSVGYCTLYGDMSGGLAVLADVPKTLVYQLADWLNAGGRVIPQATIRKAPSAELAPGQTDQDDLPPYPVLDAILEAYIEEGLGEGDIVQRLRGRGDRALVHSILERVDRNEYKRRQAAPGLKITPKAFGGGRRMPIARGSYRN